MSYFNPSRAGPLYTRGPNFIITEPADALAPNGARPSAGTVLTDKLDMLLPSLPVAPFTDIV